MVMNLTLSMLHVVTVVVSDQDTAWRYYQHLAVCI